MLLIQESEHPAEEVEPVLGGLIRRITTQAAAEEGRGVAEGGRVVVRDTGQAEGGALHVVRRASPAQLAAALTDLLCQLHGPPLGAPRWRSSCSPDGQESDGEQEQ